MTPNEQKTFVSELSKSVIDDIVTEIENGKIPEDWDGHELRQYLADCFNRANFVKMDRSRMNEYRNTVLVNNL